MSLNEGKILEWNVTQFTVYEGSGRIIARNIAIQCISFDCPKLPVNTKTSQILIYDFGTKS